MEIDVIEYLKNENIEIIHLNFDLNWPLETEFESCDCGIGQRIIVGVDDLDIIKMEDLGFYR